MSTHISLRHIEWSAALYWYSHGDFPMVRADTVCSLHGGRCGGTDPGSSAGICGTHGFSASVGARWPLHWWERASFTPWRAR